MRNLIKMELEKLFSSRMIYICLCLLILIIPLTYGFKILLIEKGLTNNEAIAAFYRLSLQDYVLISLKNEISSGLIFFLISIAITVITVEDYVNGTQKYLLLATNRSIIAYGKTVIVMLVTLIMSLTLILSTFMVGIFTKSWDFAGVGAIPLFLSLLTFTGITIVFALIANYLALYINNTIGVIGTSILVLVIFNALGLFLPRRLLFMSFLLHTESFPSVQMPNLLSSLTVLITYMVVFFSLNYRKIRSKSYYM